jgi:hypothetical protein
MGLFGLSLQVVRIRGLGGRRCVDQLRGEKVVQAYAVSTGQIDQIRRTIRYRADVKPSVEIPQPVRQVIH